MAIVYASPEYVSTLETSTPASAHVQVDFELQGCPPDKRQLLEVIIAFLHERRPAISDAQRLRRVQARRQRLRDGRARHALPRAGDARGLRRSVPSYHRGCFGCFGPMEAPNPGALGDHLGLDEVDVVRLFRTFYAGEPAFGESHG